MNTPADIQAVVDQARSAAVQVLLTIPDHSTGTAAQATQATERALEALQNALLVGSYEAQRQRDVQAAREARAQVDAALPTKPSVKIRKTP